MIPQKVQIDPDDLRFVEEACAALNYRSKSEYFRAAIREKIRSDRARLRALRRQEAMEAYGDGYEDVFLSIEGEDFAGR